MGLFQRFSAISRRRKHQLFYDLLRPSPTDRILDVGGQVSGPDVPPSQMQFIDSYPNKQQLTTINISPTHIESVVATYPEVDAYVGDACALPFDDNSFDIIYSNAVIEHVGDYKKQRQMAAEIMRVGRRWFVTTPNRWYPFEFHLRLPLVTWLPCHGYLAAGRLVCYNHIKRKYVVGAKRGDLRLMTAGELTECFPGCRVLKQRVTFMPETLIVVSENEIR